MSPDWKDAAAHNEAIANIATRAVDLYDIEGEDLRTTLRTLDLLTAGADGAAEDTPGKNAPLGTYEYSRINWARSEADRLRQAHDVVQRIIEHIASA